MKTSIIICSYNEQKTVAAVVTACCKFMPEAEVIVVDDGSQDNSQNTLTELQKQYAFVYKRLEQNKGKSWAMACGVEVASGEIILFFDADVSNVQKEHLQNLVTPLINNEADIVLGQPSETVIDYRINPFRLITGQRALLKKDVLPILPDIRDIRFGVETFINLYYQAHGKRFKYILLQGLKHPTKFEKTTALKATKEFIAEGREIAVTLINNHDLINQRVKLLIDKTNAEALNRVKELQKKINKRLQNFKNDLDNLFKN